MTNAEQIAQWRSMPLYEGYEAEMIDMIEQQQAKIDAMALEFERALDVAREAAETPQINCAVQVVTDFIENSSFEESQRLLAQRDLANKIEALESYANLCGILRQEPSTRGLRMRIEQLKNGGEL